MRKKIIDSLSIVAILLILGWATPLTIKTYFPSFWGKLEGKYEKDLTGFCFILGKGAGDCRIKNSKIAFTEHGAKIILGHLTNPVIMKQSFSDYHLWGQYSNGNLIDVVCPPDKNPICKDRTFFAIIDADTLKLEYNNPTNEKDRGQVEWAMNYLPTFKSFRNK